MIVIWSFVYSRGRGNQILQTAHQFKPSCHQGPGGGRADSEWPKPRRGGATAGGDLGDLDLPNSSSFRPSTHKAGLNLKAYTMQELFVREMCVPACKNTCVHIYTHMQTLRSTALYAFVYTRSAEGLRSQVSSVLASEIQSYTAHYPWSGPLARSGGLPKRGGGVPFWGSPYLGCSILGSPS